MSDFTETTGDYTVLTLNRRVSELLDTAFPSPVWVRGEVAEVSTTTARGHTYFRLVDPSPDGMGQAQAVIDCALFAGTRPVVVREFAREGQVFQLEQGMTLRIQGRVTVWDRGGRYQLIVSRIDPVWSLGHQAMKLRKLVESLRKEGVLETNGELSMPSLPLKVGLITARGSAASYDFLQGLKQSGYPFQVHVAWSSMQGSSTASEVIKAFNELLKVPGLDTVVLTRGGGSATDLAWFNDEHIGRVISQVPWPVISGIGHETDTTLPDYVCHTSVKTPTHCADFLVNRVADFAADLESLATVLHRSVTERVFGERRTLESMGAVLKRSGRMVLRSLRRQLCSHAEWYARSLKKALSSTSAELARTEERLVRNLRTAGIVRRRDRIDGLRKTLVSNVMNRLEKCSLELGRLEASVTASDPSKLYRRGWATVRGEDGQLIRSVSGTSPGERIDVTLKDGVLKAVTEETVSEGKEHGRK
ncbi:MAG: exodeoxyribonuclease VII large subunit [Candidatus Aegiribacteria sp.]|nr:exodeoxyribonuclease VII large subunit [Candidatus Aegiribacteria sp.]MBD3295539.1 exodeoxyribonuclease VII large subunit [Candidatus Fermentibacteria bacterium]